MSFTVPWLVRFPVTVRAPPAPLSTSMTPPDWLVSFLPVATARVELLPQPDELRCTVPALVSSASTVVTALFEHVPLTVSVCPETMAPSTVSPPPWATMVEAPVPV